MLDDWLAGWVGRKMGRRKQGRGRGKEREREREMLSRGRVARWMAIRMKDEGRGQTTPSDDNDDNEGYQRHILLSSLLSSTVHLPCPLLLIAGYLILVLFSIDPVSHLLYPLFFSWLYSVLLDIPTEPSSPDLLHFHI